MKRVETAISRLMPDIDGKRVLEPACGCAEFSIAATAHAAEVVCFDLDDQRLNPEARIPKGSALKSWMPQRCASRTVLSIQLFCTTQSAIWRISQNLFCGNACGL